jgi:hypothetical protein
VTRYYSIDDANAALEEVRPLLERLRADRDEVATAQQALTAVRRADGSGDHAEELERRAAAIRRIVGRMQTTVSRLDALDVTLRDIGTGLIDFPALVSGRPVWLCWRLGEGEIAWWHDTDSGFDGRRPLIDLE